MPSLQASFNTFSNCFPVCFCPLAFAVSTTQCTLPLLLYFTPITGVLEDEPQPLLLNFSLVSLSKWTFSLRGLATDIGFIHLPNGLKAILVFLLTHNLTDKVKHTPSTLLRLHTKFPLQLTSGNPLLRYHNKVHGIKPHTDVKMGVFKDGSFQYGEMRFAVITVQILAVFGTVTIYIMNASAERTDISTVVLNFDDEVNGWLFRGETLIEIKNRYSSSPFT